MDNTLKPMLGNTVRSARGLLWSIVMLGYFLAALALYNAWSRMDRLRTETKLPVATPVKAPDFNTKLDPAWKAYARAGDSIICLRDPGKMLPMLIIGVTDTFSFYYRALDVDMALVQSDLKGDLKTAGFPSEIVTPVQLQGSEWITALPGVKGARFFFDAGPACGEAVCFYLGSRRYFVLGIAADDDDAGVALVNRSVYRFTEKSTFPQYREMIDRPSVDSSRLTPAQYADVMQQAAAEFALADLYVSRRQVTGDTALLPAIEHYRNALSLLSSIRQERAVLETEGFKRHREYVAERAAAVREWFILLDKYTAMKDYRKAREQAKYIIEHATGTSEALDVREAQARLAKLPDPDAKKAAQAE